jgi:hypothetical protein
MWNNKENCLELLGELGRLELNTLTKCYVFKKYIGKVNLPTLPIEFAVSLFSSNNLLKVGELIIHLPIDELMANLTLEYQVSISEKALAANTFTKFYSYVKEDLIYLEELAYNYVKYAKELIKSMGNSKDKSIDRLDAVKKSLENLNINTKDNNEN